MNPTILRRELASAERENCRASLTNQNYVPVTTDNAEFARRRCLHLEPDRVLLDDHLRRACGAGLCGRLRQDHALVSSAPTWAELVEGRDRGAEDFSGSGCFLGDGLRRIESLLGPTPSLDGQATSLVLSLAHTIEARHSRTDGHSDRLAEHAMQLGESLGLSEDDLRELRLGCLLHDIGKVAVPDNILLKPARLSPEEMGIVRQHPVTGEKICAPLHCLRPILPLIRHHHERMDGRGYPDRLCGEEIPLKARILQVADVYDALTSDRPYREALSSEEALAILHQEALYGWLDASLVWRFSRMRRSGDHFSLRGQSMLASQYACLKLPHVGHGIENAWGRPLAGFQPSMDGRFHRPFSPTRRSMNHQTEQVRTGPHCRTLMALMVALKQGRSGCDSISTCDLSNLWLQIGLCCAPTRTFPALRRMHEKQPEPQPYRNHLTAMKLYSTCS